MVAAIDFTASNGDPAVKGTNHTMNLRPGAKNDYERVLETVCNTIMFDYYDNDADENDSDYEPQSIPVFGFGAIPLHLGIQEVNHCFALNGDPCNPEIAGVKNILHCYREALQQIKLAGPTMFGPLLEQFESYVK